MKFSLVLATLNRTAEVAYFLKTLNQQTYRNFELIVVDRNSDDRLVEILRAYQSHFSILHLRSAPGLSFARNVALPHLSGELVAFPDDDCAYGSDLLDRVAHFFATQSEWNGLTGRSISQQGQNSSGRWDHVAGKITPINVWQRGASYTIFLRRSTIATVGPFDESLGVGAKTPWGSAEDIDYLLRSLGTGLYYEPAITVTHPVKLDQPSDAPCNSPKPRNFSKTYAYALGRGRVLRKHNAPMWFVLYNWGRPLAGITLMLLRGRFHEIQSHWATLRGRFQGWTGWA